MSKKIKPKITPTVTTSGKEEGDLYHYNAADNAEMLERWENYPQEDIVEAVPIQLDIETTSVCNLQCPMCFQSSDETRPTKLNMERELFEEIIDEFSAKGGMSIKMMYRGEPLVTRDIHEWVAYATERGIQACFNTNGTLLSPDRSQEFIDAGLRQIIFSIDSHIPEEYNQIRRPNANKLGNFEKTLGNVRKLSELRDQAGTKYPIIEVSRVNLPETRRTAKDFSDFWLGNGADYVSMVDLNDYSLEKGQGTLVSTDFACEMPWQRMFVLSDGLVTQCCGDLYQRFPLAQLATQGNVKKYTQRLEEIANGTTQPGEKVEFELLSQKDLEKHVIGTVQDDMSVGKLRMRVRGITGEVSQVPITSSVEEAWRGQRSEYMRQVNREGASHKINACRECGYRQTTIKKHGLKYEIKE